MDINLSILECKSTCALIHEYTHYQYFIGHSQWAECVCVSQELLHRLNRNYLTYSELKMVVKAVKEVYPEYNWRKGGFINGRKKENKSLTERLLLGEKVLCKRCGKGYYITDAKEAPKGHGFYCNICDDLINLDPIIDIE